MLLSYYNIVFMLNSSGQCVELKVSPPTSSIVFTWPPRDSSRSQKVIPKYLSADISRSSSCLGPRGPRGNEK